MDRKKIYYHIGCPAHGTDHSMDLMSAVRQDCTMLVTLCSNFISHAPNIYKIFEISLVLPSEALEIIEKENGFPPTR